MARTAFRAAVPALALAALLSSCERGEEKRSAEGPVEVGLVLSTGGRGDHGFNDAAIAGLSRAAARLGADTAISENVTDESRGGEMKRYADQGKDLVVGISFMVSESAFDLAQKYPDVHFAVLDYAPVLDEKGNAKVPPPNMAGLTHREEEAAFLAGALAGLMTKTNRVGFVGGMTVPTIRRFEAGYTAGVEEVCPGCEVLVGYAGDTPAAFNAPAKGKELALGQYAAGADIIFHASGATGRGVFDAAMEADRWAIGVDQDQSREAPGHVLTSVTKNLDVSVFRVIQQQKEGRFQGGTVSLGLAEGAMGWVLNDSNRRLIPDSVVHRVETLREAIVAGLIRVPRVPLDRSRFRR